jgi:hypothetical protein
MVKESKVRVPISYHKLNLTGQIFYGPILCVCIIDILVNLDSEQNKMFGENLFSTKDIHFFVFFFSYVTYLGNVHHLGLLRYLWFVLFWDAHTLGTFSPILFLLSVVQFYFKLLYFYGRHAASVC